MITSKKSPWDGIVCDPSDAHPLIAVAVQLVAHLAPFAQQIVANRNSNPEDESDDESDKDDDTIALRKAVRKLLRDGALVTIDGVVDDKDPQDVLEAFLSLQMYVVSILEQRSDLETIFNTLFTGEDIVLTHTYDGMYRTQTTSAFSLVVLEASEACSIPEAMRRRGIPDPLDLIEVPIPSAARNDDNDDDDDDEEAFEYKAGQRSTTMGKVPPILWLTIRDSTQTPCKSVHDAAATATTTGTSLPVIETLVLQQCGVPSRDSYRLIAAVTLVPAERRLRLFIRDPTHDNHYHVYENDCHDVVGIESISATTIPAAAGGYTTQVPVHILYAHPNEFTALTTPVTVPHDPTDILFDDDDDDGSDFCRVRVSHHNVFMAHTGWGVDGVSGGEGSACDDAYSRPHLTMCFAKTDTVGDLILRAKRRFGVPTNRMRLWLLKGIREEGKGNRSGGGDSRILFGTERFENVCMGNDGADLFIYIEVAHHEVAHSSGTLLAHIQSVSATSGTKSMGNVLQNVLHLGPVCPHMLRGDDGIDDNVAPCYVSDDGDATPTWSVSFPQSIPIARLVIVFGDGNAFSDDVKTVVRVFNGNEMLWASDRLACSGTLPSGHTVAMLDCPVSLTKPAATRGNRLDVCRRVCEEGSQPGPLRIWGLYIIPAYNMKANAIRSNIKHDTTQPCSSSALIFFLKTFNPHSNALVPLGTLVVERWHMLGEFMAHFLSLLNIPAQVYAGSDGAVEVSLYAETAHMSVTALPLHIPVFLLRNMMPGVLVSGRALILQVRVLTSPVVPPTLIEHLEKTRGQCTVTFKPLPQLHHQNGFDEFTLQLPGDVSFAETRDQLWDMLEDVDRAELIQLYTTVSFVEEGGKRTSKMVRQRPCIKHCVRELLRDATQGTLWYDVLEIAMTDDDWSEQMVVSIADEKGVVARTFNNVVVRGSTRVAELVAECINKMGGHDDDFVDRHGSQYELLRISNSEIVRIYQPDERAPSNPSERGILQVRRIVAPAVDDDNENDASVLRSLQFVCGNRCVGVPLRIRVRTTDTWSGLFEWLCRTHDATILHDAPEEHHRVMYKHHLTGKTMYFDGKAAVLQSVRNEEKENGPVTLVVLFEVKRRQARIRAEQQQQQQTQEKTE
eukprot:PhM_4_TR8858/c0_g2_i1/m.4756